MTAPHSRRSEPYGAWGRPPGTPDSKPGAIRIALLACSLALAGLVLAIVLIPPPSRSTPVAAHRAPTTASPAPTANRPGSAPATPSATSTTSAPSTVAPTTPAKAAPPTATVTAGSGPDLTTVTPAAGHRGDRVTLSGAGLYSSDGVITVMFGSVQAPVSCPTRTMCTVTVPAQPAPAAAGGPVTVTLTTSAGTSRPVHFSYLS